MNDQKKPRPRKRPSKNTFITKSGNSIKLHQSITERFRARREAKARRRAAHLSEMPKNRFHRVLYRLSPKNVFRYWFSREGAIMALKIVGIAIVVGFVFIVGLFAYFRKDLPNITDISGSTLPGSTSYYDRTGTILLWQDYSDSKRVQVEGDKISQNMKNATIAVEDKDFYKHGAFDVTGIARAGLHDVLNQGGGTQGGSTITQQLVKLNQSWTADRSITRKIKELILAVELEREYSKNDILNGYLNAAPYGPVENGVQTAAQDYFGVDAKDLTIAQAAMLAAIPKSPNVYSPYGPAYDEKKLLARKDYIIDQMVNQGLITKQQGDEAKKADVLSQIKPPQQSSYDGIKAPYFVLAAKDELISKFSQKTVDRGGWKVITSLDMPLQELAEKAVADDLPTIRNQKGKEAAFVAEENQTGQVVALVGGIDFNDPNHGKINYATKVNISPGSSFKPYDYTAFIENNTNVGAGSVLYDSQGPLPQYPCTHPGNPQNDDNVNCLVDYDYPNFPGAVTLRYALGGSRNIPAVKAMVSAVPNDPDTKNRINSINKTISTAKAMMGNDDGYRCYVPGTDTFEPKKSDETQCYSSSAIGDGAYLYLDDHVNGIATLARLGLQVPQTYILKITNSSNKVIYEFQQPTGKQVIRPDTAYIVDDMASDPKASYLPGSCTDTSCTPLRSFGYKFQRYNGWHFAVKTGTTNFGYDGLMASWSTKYTAIAWVGVDIRQPAYRMRGNMETMTEPIVRAWMEGAHKDLKPVNWTTPSGIKNLPAYVRTAKVSKNGEIMPSPSNDIYPSWYQQPKAGSGSATIDLVSGKKATSCTPDLAKKTEGGANSNAFSADIFVGTSNNSGDTNGSDDVHNCNDAKPSVSVSTPASCTDVNTCQFTVTVSQGTHPLSGGSYTTPPAGTVTLIINGQNGETVSIPTDQSVWTHVFNYTPSGNGSVTVQARAVDSVLYNSDSGTNTVTIGAP